MERVSTGVDGLDKMLHSGLVPGRPYIVRGLAGTGKSILCTHFLMDGLRKGEQCMLVALDEPPNEIKANMATFGWSLDQLTALDATPDIKSHKKKNVIDVGTTLDVRDMEKVSDVRKSMQIRTMEVTIHSVQKMIKQQYRDLLERKVGRYTRVVIRRPPAADGDRPPGDDRVPERRDYRQGRARADDRPAVPGEPGRGRRERADRRRPREPRDRSGARRGDVGGRGRPPPRHRRVPPEAVRGGRALHDHRQVEAQR